MDGQTDRETVSRTYGQTDRQTDRWEYMQRDNMQTHRKMDGEIGGLRDR